MAKRFTYRNIEIEIRISGRGQYIIEGMSGKYEGVTATRCDSEIYDFCDDESNDNCQWARRCAYNALRMNF